jgi:predicted NAD/FAD-binding protein
MNLLQSIPEADFGPVLVTLNPPFEPKPELVAKEYWYEHPLFSELVSLRVSRTVYRLRDPLADH